MRLPARITLPRMSKATRNGPGALRCKTTSNRRRVAGHRGARRAYVACSWTYALLLQLWLVLQRSVGDASWWLALANSFAPFLFLPVALQLVVGALVRGRVAWASILVTLGTFLFVYGDLYIPARRPDVAPGATSITVMSFNIWGLSQSQETARAVREAGPADIVVLQELSPKMAGLLVVELGSEYPYHALEIGGRDYGLGAFSRYPLVRVEANHPWDPLSPVQVLRVARGGDVFFLYNVHLQASNVLVQVDTGGSLAEYTMLGVRAREGQLRRLVADIATRTEPVLVTGDFNSTEMSSGYRMLAQKVTDAHRAAGWGLGHTFPAYGGTWHRLPILRRMMRLDMIFCSQELAPLTCRVASAHGESDHLPVVAQFVRSR